VRLVAVVGLFGLLAACAPGPPPSTPAKTAGRAARPLAGEARGRRLAFIVHWTSLAHEPFIERLRASLRVADEVEIACHPRRSGTFSAQCEASDLAAGLSALELALPPELAGPLVVPLDGREASVEVDAWLGMTEGDRPILDTVTLRRDRPAPPGLVLRRQWTPASDGFGTYLLENGTREPVSVGDMWLETARSHRRWQCMGCGNVGSAPPPLQPGQTGYLSMHHASGAYRCSPPAVVKSNARHRFLVRLASAARPIEVPEASWPVRPPRLSERLVYELSDEFELVE
jgi:hypothetical protein